MEASTAARAGYHAVTPYLIIKGAAEAIEFYKTIFGANERMRMKGPDGLIMHAEIVIGDTALMLCDEWPDMNYVGPQALGGSPVTLHLYVDDVDATVDRAVTAGATIARPVENQFYGDRSGTVVDPFGHIWHVATHVEDVPEDELHRRAEACMREMAGS